MRNKITAVILLAMIFIFTVGSIYTVVHRNQKILSYKQVRVTNQVVVNASKLNPKFEVHYEERKSKFERLSESHMNSIVMLGDSLTESGSWNELSHRDNLSNYGIAGDTTFGVLHRLDNLSPEIKKVFIMIGTNDLGCGESVAYVFSNYKKIIEILEIRGIKPYIQSVLYVGRFDRSKRDNKDIAKLNHLLLKFAMKKGITFIDLNKVLAPKGVLHDEYTTDGVHINEKAYKIWVKNIKQYF